MDHAQTGNSLLDAILALPGEMLRGSRPGAMGTVRIAPKSRGRSRAAAHIAGYKLRQPDQKRFAVEALQRLNYGVIAAVEADSHLLFRSPNNVVEEFPQFPAMTDFDDLLRAIDSACHDVSRQ